MAHVVSFAGQKGGTGKSMLSQAFAVKSAKEGKKVLLADLDVGQRTSHEWAEARMNNEHTPYVKAVVVEPVRHEDFGLMHLKKDCDVLIVDAPGWSDEKTLMLAAYSDIMVLPTGASTADLRPTIRLMHELVRRGITEDRIFTALCRVKSASEIKFAREYVKEAGYKTLPGMLRDMPTFRNLQNIGMSALEVEPKHKEMLKEAKELIEGIQEGLNSYLKRIREKPEQFVHQPERFHEVERDR